MDRQRAEPSWSSRTKPAYSARSSSGSNPSPMPPLTHLSFLSLIRTEMSTLCSKPPDAAVSPLFPSHSQASPVPVIWGFGPLRYALQPPPLRSIFSELSRSPSTLRARHCSGWSGHLGADVHLRKL
jgi:hypothetical protein